MERNPIRDDGNGFVSTTTGLNANGSDNNLGPVQATRSQQFNLSDVLGPFTSTTGPAEEGKEAHSYFFFKVTGHLGFLRVEGFVVFAEMRITCSRLHTAGMEKGRI